MKIGLKFRKIPDVVAPNFCTPIFQNTIQSTVEMSPVYKSDVMKEELILETVKLPMLNGSNKMTPKMPEYNVAISGVTVFVAHLLQTE